MYIYICMCKNKYNMYIYIYKQYCVIFFSFICTQHFKSTASMILRSCCPLVRVSIATSLCQHSQRHVIRMLWPKISPLPTRIKPVIGSASSSVSARYDVSNEHFWRQASTKINNIKLLSRFHPESLESILIQNRIAVVRVGDHNGWLWLPFLMSSARFGPQELLNWIQTSLNKSYSYLNLVHWQVSPRDCCSFIVLPYIDFSNSKSETFWPAKASLRGSRE